MDLNPKKVLCSSLTTVIVTNYPTTFPWTEKNPGDIDDGEGDDAMFCDAASDEGYEDLPRLLTPWKHYLNKYLLIQLN